MCAHADGMLARFVVQTREDLELVQQDARSQFNLRITATNFAGNAQQVLTHPKGDASKYARCEKLQSQNQDLSLPWQLLPHTLPVLASLLEMDGHGAGSFEHSRGPASHKVDCLHRHSDNGLIVFLCFVSPAQACQYLCKVSKCRC